MLKCSRNFLALIPLILAGCGSGDQPELGEVTGIVTVDDKPVVGVNVVFKPDVGRPAGAKTDSEGRYTLQYLDGVEGCKVGPNSVSFDWPPESENPPVAIPPQFSGPGVFKVDVKSGSNTFDLKMNSK